MLLLLAALWISAPIIVIYNLLMHKPIGNTFLYLNFCIHFEDNSASLKKSGVTYKKIFVENRFLGFVWVAEHVSFFRSEASVPR